MSQTICLYCKLPELTAENKLFLCYEDGSPIPWERDIFFVKDEQERNWFCHEVNNVPLSKAALNNLAQQLQRQYAPQSGEALARRVPFTAHIAVCRAKELDELRHYLGQFKFAQG